LGAAQEGEVDAAMAAAAAGDGNTGSAISIAILEGAGCDGHGGVVTGEIVTVAALAPAVTATSESAPVARDRIASTTHGGSVPAKATVAATDASHGARAALDAPMDAETACVASAAFMAEVRGLVSELATRVPQWNMDGKPETKNSA
jgi:hypothetical protein